MTKNKLIDKFEKLTSSLKRLKEMLEEKTDNKIMKRDASIQRFEFTIELFWNLLKRLIEFSGEKTVLFPKQIMQKAYAYHLIDNEEIWIHMLDDRNMTSHIYDEEKIDKIFDRIKKYYPEMQKTYDLLKERFKEELTK